MEKDILTKAEAKSILEYFKDFDLGTTLEETEINFILAKVNQIPGYERIRSLLKLVKDDVLRDVLAQIALGHVTDTTPRNMETLIEKSQKALVQEKEVREKQSQLTKEQIAKEEAQAKILYQKPPETSGREPALGGKEQPSGVTGMEPGTITKISPEASQKAAETWGTLSPQAKNTVQNLQNLTQKGEAEFTKQIIASYQGKALDIKAQAAIRAQIPKLYDRIINLPQTLYGTISPIPLSQEEGALLSAMGGKPVSNEIASKIFAPKEESVPELPSSVPYISPSTMQLASKEIMNADPKKGMAAWMASKGFKSSPLLKEQIRAAGQKYGVDFSNETINLLASFANDYPIYGSLVEIKAIKMGDWETQALRDVTSPEGAAGIISQGPGGLRGIWSLVKQQVQGKAAKALVEKAAQSAGGQMLKEGAKRVLAKTAVSKITAALGTALGPLGTLLGWFGGELLTRVGTWLIKNKDKIAASLMAGGVVALIAGLIPLGIGGLAAGGAIALGGGLRPPQIIGQLLEGFGFIGQNLLAELAKPLIITILVFSVLVGFILLIINNSAFVIPGEELNQTDIGIQGSCPIPNGIVSCGSLGSGSACQHGSQAYWNGIVNSGGEQCEWGLPSSDGVRCSTSPTSNTPCYDSGSQCKNSDGTVVYGYSADIVYPNQGACDGTQTVYFPYINGQSLTWQKTLSFTGTAGANGIYTATDGANIYELYFVHLDSVVPSGRSGGPVGALSCTLTSPHVHVELRINGDFIRPDSLCTGDAVVVSGGACDAPGPYGQDFDPIPKTTVAGIEVSQDIALRVTEFITYANNLGFNLVTYEGYRTYERQLNICNDCQTQLKSNPNAPCAAAPAAQSQHRTGRAVDFYLTADYSSVTPMLNDARIQRKMQDLNIVHPYPTDVPHFYFE